MVQVPREQFEHYVTQAIANVPEPYKSQLQNVAFFVENEPSPEQRTQLGLRPCQSLFGLYQGVPLPARGGNSGNLLPDSITIFVVAHEQAANSLAELQHQINNTVWHEVAHYFGLDHKRIHELQRPT